MTYDQILKLKEAGFPQMEKGKFITKNNEVLDYQLSYTVYLPTLSELIDACGDSFEALIRQAGGWAATHNHENYGTRQVSNSNIGSTPEEAVANLYLALHQRED